MSLRKLTKRKKPLPSKKIHFISLGCPRNLVDTEIMIKLAQTKGYEPTPYLEEATYIVINTCGFLKAARKESIETIEAIIASRNHDSKIIVAGCMVQLRPKELEALQPHIHYYLGSGDLPHFLDALQSEETGTYISNTQSYLAQDSSARTLSTPPHYAYLKIAEGCRKHCSYCIIPKIKGPLRSKSASQILKEFHFLLQQGVKEIILIAQDLGDWGKDLGYQGSSGLVYVLEQLLKIPQEFRLRLLYVYPDEITPSLIKTLASDPRILPYLDMPIQHSHDPILQSMRRTTSQAQLHSIISQLRTAIPNISLRTSLIIGFPGETEESFDDLCQFIQTNPFEHIGIFPYSREKGSSAYHLQGQIPKKLKDQRCQILSEIQKKMVIARNKKLIGTQLPAFIDGYHPETPLLMIGRHDGQAPEIDPVILINQHDNVSSFGQPHLVEISDVSEYDLVGHVINPL